MSDEIKRPDRVLVVARDPEHPLRKQDLRWLMMWMEGGSDMPNSAMATTVPVDLYQLIDGKWSFVGEPREARPFMVDDQTMMVPMHEKACDYEWIGFVMYRKVDGYWRKTEAKRLDGPTVPYRDPFTDVTNVSGVVAEPDQYHMIDQGLFAIPTHGVPIGYDIEDSDSPQPTAEEEAEARELAKSSKDMARHQTDRPRGIIAQTDGRPISVVERPTEPPKQETWRDRPSLF